MLKIPGAVADNLYAGGVKLDDAWYRVEPEQQLVRWSRQEAHPASAALAVSLTKELMSTERLDFWKKLTVLIPVLTAIISAYGAYAVATASAEAKKPPKIETTLPDAKTLSPAYERWTVIGRVQMQSGSPYAILSMVHPPRIEFNENGKFEATIPVENLGNGDHLYPTLTFASRQPGYRTAVVELGDDQAEIIGMSAADKAIAAQRATAASSADATAHGNTKAEPGYAPPDYKLKVDLTRRRIEIGRPVMVEKEQTAYNPQSAMATQAQAPEIAKTQK